ncbi:hypothetical protein [Amycolatopsis sp. NPDC004079]|uniref:hypothetical protein n=1 Tax=Amycolatopsis sp. NPDC004079 TaxID=3154549 RepID=UPI0033B866B8
MSIEFRKRSSLVRSFNRLVPAGVGIPVGIVLAILDASWLAWVVSAAVTFALMAAFYLACYLTRDR